MKDYVPDLVPVAVFSTVLYWVVYSHQSGVLGDFSMLVHGVFTMSVVLFPFTVSALEDGV